MATSLFDSQAEQTAVSLDIAMPPLAERGEAVFPIVGMGASAGGLEAFEAFFHACPAQMDMAFVLVSHLAPDHHSLLCEILQRCTSLTVSEATDQTPVVPNHIYIIPPNREMRIQQGVLQIFLSDQARGQRMPIDGFFSSLADDQAENAIGIILSGTASDGTLGLRAIFNAGGIGMVQTPATAKYDGMPQSAIHAGYATHILAVEEMPALLLKLVRQSNLRQKMPTILTEEAHGKLDKILLHIRSHTGHDFSSYKKSTIGRRIGRRMAHHHIDDMAVYARFLEQNPQEVHALFKDMLINVTRFFRDAEAFAILKQDILPLLLADKPDDYVFRVWVAACASGEEAYSIAMLLRELMTELHLIFKVQIYATDIDDEAISVARSGLYLSSIAEDVSPERLRRFFTPVDGRYKIKADIRDMVVFAVQSIIKDPPFTKLDLLSCRNLMIYLEQAQQARLIPSFYYALKPGGVLFLSGSESLLAYPELFSPLNRKWKFYQANHTASKPSLTVMRSASIVPNLDTTPVKRVVSKVQSTGVAELSNHALLQLYAPASVTTNLRGDILYVHGDTSAYLRPPPGLMSTNVVDMARDPLQFHLRTALHAIAQGEMTLNQPVALNLEHDTLNVVLSVRLLPSSGGDAAITDNLLLIGFQEIAKVAKSAQPVESGDALAQQHIQDLERELTYAKANLQSIIEEQQATNEELKSTNEELQSTNEELQSSNEELETSKEELQSLNEETITVNSELNSKIEQLNVVQSDLKNLLDNVNAGTLFLDYHLNIRSYTRDAVKVYRLIASDVGRPLGDITSNLASDHLLDDLHRVLETLIPCEREVSAIDGTWYLARMKPYRTLDNLIDGVVLTFTDITQNREAAQIKLAAFQLARELAEGIVNAINEPLLVLDEQLQVVSASPAFYPYFQMTPAQTLGCNLYALGNQQWDIPALRDLIERVSLHQAVGEGGVLEYDFVGLGVRRWVLSVRRIHTMGETRLILLSMRPAGKSP